MGGKFGALNPLDCRAIDRLRLTVWQVAEKKLQQDGAFGICVFHGLEQCSDDDFDAKFLAQLADKALLEGFARLTFAARKFPQAAEVRSGVTLGNEQFSRTKDQAGADFDDLASHQRPMLL